MFHRHRYYCDGCTLPIPQGETICHSGVYAPGSDFELCKSCSDREEAAIDDKGTNDVPDLVQLYTANREELLAELK